MIQGQKVNEKKHSKKFCNLALGKLKDEKRKNNNKFIGYNDVF